MEKKIKKGELEYKFILFKLKGHETWRMNNIASMKEVNPDNITEQKTLIVDRLTGKVSVS